MKKNVNEIYTVKEAATNLKCSKKTIYRLCKEGRVNSFKLGNIIKIYKESLVEENLNSIRPKF